MAAMVISGAAGQKSGATHVPDVSSDVQIRQIKFQIQDWQTCPTTDPQTKQEKVQKLQTQLDSVKSGLERQAQRKAEADTRAAAPKPRDEDLRARGATFEIAA